jgi:phage shock protein PspC (stress-responsive transcriptional regulator)
MHDAQHNLLTRPDTFFGVCEGLGEDFHIHPNILRVTLAGMLFWNPPAAIGAYAAAGALVACRAGLCRILLHWRWQTRPMLVRLTKAGLPRATSWWSPTTKPVACLSPRSKDGDVATSGGIAAAAA